jgi:hypothetical protein
VTYAFFAIGLSVLSAVGALAVADPAKTTYTLPQDICWLPITGNGVPRGAYYAYLRGNPGDACGPVVINRFPDGFVYPWHINHEYDLITILKGTMVLGFDRQHKKSAERVLPAGSFIQGLATEPHYGRAVGETIFEYFSPCPLPK